jgi:hypothetical protein
MVFEGGATQPEAASDLGVTRVFLGPPERGAIGHVVPPAAMIGRDGAFSSVPVTPGNYLVSVFAQPRGWRLGTAMIGGRDAADAPIELLTDRANVVVTMTNRPLGISGQVTTRTGDTAPFAIVLTYPANRMLWTDFGLGRRFRSIVTASDGGFSFNDLPAGEYFLAAVTVVPDSGWRDEVWLTTLAGMSRRVRVAERGLQRVSLTLLTAPPR